MLCLAECGRRIGYEGVHLYLHPPPVPNNAIGSKPHDPRSAIAMRNVKGTRHHQGRHRNGARTAAEAQANAAGVLQPGIEAPDFELLSTPDQKVDLNHFRGRPVVLVFYPADWSPVCSDQLTLYNEILPEFNTYAAQLLGLSVDSAWCHTAYAQHSKLHFPLLADFEPKGNVA